MKIIDLVQRSPEWHEFRKSHIGASEISVIMGENPWKTQYQLWLEKTGSEEPKKLTAAMQRGVDLESEALHNFISIVEEFYEPKVGVYDNWAHASASFDGISDDWSKIVEIKIPLDKSFAKMKLDGIPRYYLMQVQWQMMVSGAKSAEFFVYKNEHTNFSYTIFPDKKLQDEMLAAAKGFWELVKNNLPPPMSDKDYEIIDDDYQFSVLSDQYLEVANEIKKLESQRKAIRDAVVEYVDGRNVKGYGIRVKSNNVRKTIDLDKLRFDFNISEEELEKYYKESDFYATIHVTN